MKNTLRGRIGRWGKSDGKGGGSAEIIFQCANVGSSLPSQM